MQDSLSKRRHAVAMKARACFALVLSMLLGSDSRTAGAVSGGCRPLPTLLAASGKASPWSEKGAGEHVLDEATMAALCLGHHVARLLIRAVQVCIRTECRRQPSVTESDLCKSVHPNQASQASGYDECQFLCYVRNREAPYRYCRPPGTACTKWEAWNVQRPWILHEQRVMCRLAGSEGGNKN
ncbi:uncharacterized protein LOC144115881 isoform X5 [Amblyomma americanum]